MSRMINKALFVFCLFFPVFGFSSDLIHSFGNPSFSGVNQSAHYLTIDEQERSRKAKIADDVESKLKEIEREADNTTLSKFLRNLESRVYSQLSRDLVDSLFDSEGGGTGGSIMLEGNLITFTNTGTEIILTIVDVDGLETIISIPINSFGICTEDCEV
jgi:hypothetical protein